MPTDLSLAIGRRRADRLSAVRNETLLVVALSLFGFVNAVLAVRNPAIACALILVGSQ